MAILDHEFVRRDYFDLFGLPRQQALDVAGLDVLYRDIQSRIHPDKHAHLSDAEQRVAMQWATRVNEAYATLKDPLRRARYLLELADHDAGLETNTAMPAEFLMMQMELREAVADAREAGDIESLDSRHRQIRKSIRGEFEELQRTLDAGDHPRAAELVRQLMFQEKLLHEIDDALALLDA